MNFLHFFRVIVAVFLIAFCTTSAEQIERNDDVYAPRRAKRQQGHGVTGPVHTYVKTDKHANFKWGVRHHVGHKYAGK